MDLNTATAAPPLGMLAELTHRCPLHCPYCSNPVELLAREDELSTEEWLSVLTQARELGVLQVHMSGGEPLARPDLPILVEHATKLGCYVNLVTSGLGLTESRLDDLVERGIAHIQLSVQGATAERANRLAGARAHDRKLVVAELIKKAGLPLSVNVVLHRQNHDQLAGIIELAEKMGADRLELANTQYYGWALRNRDALMPTRRQLDDAEPIVRAATERLRGSMEIIYVVADYYEQYPKPCMYGWGARQLTVAPDGNVLPCPASTAIETLELDNVRTMPLARIWYESSSFNAYRGEDWMPETCGTCERRSIDFGGCRCQAFQLTGDAAATDPVCSRSPHRDVVDLILATPPRTDELVMRAPR
ncbi:pyrroloquinoline quinone biosynthesis protein PqqE [Amycolatopsis regifaucium]|uniref:PqqA peptide cyclase n=1 Tax=Amycolatopsis regifaucium TaxID=546365 RepID=A0A154MJ29_9PSEU|nr:pyrroloquinoline quinone biosynthesis protein PqqE [Amycolatopsis regifaucium]KZB83967.1 pyrroloquinoline quinone biosynthesis protein PqqE [Amycolatopsis regifaucium]OKA06592.1 pyrroloquinoline quinone biosynthesis protein PqqE [Amycolatopsis regifaucium]SFH21220.1 pyrroloquinoline quinone biosynthesis protein E [Amycolatopsis regifaucium]